MLLLSRKPITPFTEGSYTVFKEDTEDVEVEVIQIILLIDKID